MIGIADENGRTYESKYGTYSKKDGFRLSVLSKSMVEEELLDNLFHEDCWALKREVKKMTKEEIEKALGYEIEIEDSAKKNETHEESKYIGKNAQKPYKNVFADDFFNYLFR